MTDADRCPACDRPVTRVTVPSDLREYVPDGAAAVGSCPGCLRTVPSAGAPGTEPLTGATPPEAVPSGEGGAAVLLTVGALDSVGLNRAAIEAFLDHAERAGTDVFLTLDRLAVDESVDAHVDLERRRRQIETLLE